MHLEYIEELMKTLRETKIYRNENLLPDFEDAMAKLLAFVTEIKTSKRQLFFIGNGGSSAIASHMTADFMKNGGMKTYSLYDNAVTTCMGNDYGYEHIFSKPLRFLAGEGDMLVAISSSGNSDNIVNAVEVAREKKMKVITFSGFREDNKIRSCGDYNIYVPMEHYGMVESIHTILLQQIVDMILLRDGITV